MVDGGGTAPSLGETSPEDVAGYLDAVRRVGVRIVGNGARAGRLRFLADAVGLPAGGSVRDRSATFRSACGKAARLARRMALYQDQREASHKNVESCNAAVGSKKEELAEVERRTELIRDGLWDSDCSLVPSRETS